MPLSSLNLYSEPYGSTGNIGENFRRLLGAPALDPLQTVIRESVQNIADAAQLGIGPEIVIRIRRLTVDQQAVLSGQFLHDVPYEPTSRGRLEEFIGRREPVVMEICDFRTTGLGGPTRADLIPEGPVRTDFIDFLRNIGTPRDTRHGGGTYGFGKVALYRASRCSTIFVDTLPEDEIFGMRRLIGCHVGPSFDLPENGMRRRYTGRHWWGKSDSSDGIVDPLTGLQAEELASALGFLPRGAGRTGTSIMILDFDADGEDLAVIGQRVMEALLWNFWPKMMGDAPPESRFICTVEVDGSQLAIPAPEDFPPLDLFAKAMRAARARSGNDVRVISSKKPIKDLGHLAVETALRTPRRPLVAKGSLFPDSARHIALMRPVELVVRYLEGTPFPDERVEWAGVFIASSEDQVERAFADSEPPAHDNWIPDHLPRPAKTYVNVALRELKFHASEMGTVARDGGTVSLSGPPLARVSGRLGAALEGVGKKRSGGGGGTRPARANASRPEFLRLESDDTGTIAVFSTEVRQDSRRSGIALTAMAVVAIEGAAIGRLDDIRLQPSIVSIRSMVDGSSSDNSRIELGATGGSYEVRVRMPPDCAVMVDAHVVTKGEA